MLINILFNKQNKHNPIGYDILQLSPFPNSVKMPSRTSGLGGGNSQNDKKNRACGAKSLISNVSVLLGGRTPPAPSAENWPKGEGGFAPILVR